MSAATAHPESHLQVVQPTAIAQPQRGPRLGLPTRDELSALMQYGEVMLKSGMAPAHIKSAEAAIVVMRYGHQLGIDEFTALQNMYVIGGKPAAMASLLHSIILRDHGGGAITVKQFTPERVTIECRRKDTGQTAEVSYSWQEAEAAGITKSNQVWSKYPADMLFARCVSRAGRQLFRDSTMGMYTPEEIGGSVVEVSVDGEVQVIDAGMPSQPSKSAQPTGNPNRLARLHAIGAERGLDHNALHRIALLRLGSTLGDPRLTDHMLTQFESLIETSSDEDLILWAMDWDAEIRAAEPQGEQALLQLGERIKTAGVSKESHPGVAQAFAAALRRARETPQDALFTEIPTQGEAGNDRFTA